MKEIKLGGKKGKDKFALVDDDDFNWLNQHKWNLGKVGYANSWINSKKSYMHRLIMDCPRNKLIDHIDFNKLNNQKSNLRICNKSGNQQHQYQNHKNKTSKYRGVSFHKIPNRKGVKKWGYWFAKIKVKGKTLHIGSFKLELHAAMAYDLWAKILHKEYAILNF